MHYSADKSSIFDFSWTMRGNHVLKVVAHVSPPLSGHPGFRQYDFFVNGQSFYKFPQVYRLGLAPNDPVRASAGAGFQYGSAPPRSYTSGGRARSDNIASIEAPHDTEEVRHVTLTRKLVIATKLR